MKCTEHVPWRSTFRTVVAPSLPETSSTQVKEDVRVPKQQRSVILRSFSTCRSISLCGYVQRPCKSPIAIRQAAPSTDYLTLTRSPLEAKLTVIIADLRRTWWMFVHYGSALTNWKPFPLVVDLFVHQLMGTVCRRIASPVGRVRPG